MKRYCQLCQAKTATVCTTTEPIIYACRACAREVLITRQVTWTRIKDEEK